jgi:ABC-type phosphate transport system ATPase subunit
MPRSNHAHAAACAIETQDMIEFGDTHQIFTRPHDRRTEDDVTGRFG